MKTEVNTKILIKNNLKNVSNNIYVTIIYDGKTNVLKRHKTIYHIFNNYGFGEFIFKIKEKSQILCVYLYGEMYMCTGEYYTLDGTYTIKYEVEVS